nr:MAG TPA: hypothetical protein [Caudoviricetes sp.]
MVPIFDTCINIKNRDGFKDCNVEMIDTLHSMLNDMKVPHAFVLVSEAEVNRINSESEDYEYCCSLMFMDDDKITCELVYVLWNKVYRDAPDDNVLKALSIVGTYPLRPESALL